MKNMIKFMLVFALAAGLTACSKNVKDDAAADNIGTVGAVEEIAADDTIIIEEEEAVIAIDNTAITLAPVYFALNQYTLSKEARAVLEANAEILKVKGVKTITVEGNCDDRGTIAYNIALGDKRAKEVKDYYVKLGLNADEIYTISYGKERPACTEQTNACWAKNRRSDTVIQ